MVLAGLEKIRVFQKKKNPNPPVFFWLYRLMVIYLFLYFWGFNGIFYFNFSLFISFININSDKNKFLTHNHI